MGEDTFGSTAENGEVIFAGIKVETDTERKGFISKVYAGTMANNPEQHVSIEILDIPTNTDIDVYQIKEAFRIAKKRLSTF